VNVDGNIKFQNAFIKQGLVPIHGTEFYIVNDLTKKEKGEKRSHLIAFVKNDIGWKNMLKLLTISNIEGYYYRPRIDPETLLKYSEGLIISTACQESFINEEWGKSLLKKLYLKIENDLYFEVMPHKSKEQIEINELAIDYAKKYKCKVIATNDCHYVSNGDEKSQEVLLAIQSKKKWSDSTRWKFSINGLYLKSYDEMVDAFIDQNAIHSKWAEEYLYNTLEIYDKCKNFKITEKEVSLPIIPELKNTDISPETYLKKLCKNGFKNKISKNSLKTKKLDIYLDRLETELELIVKQGFCEYFLIVYEMINWCKDNNIMTGPSRGSAGGSLVCYLIGITKIDPIEFGLLFSRFISPDRIDLPDIDNDFQDNKRQLVIDHFKEIYGENHVASVSTFMTMKGKCALRDVARVFDIDLDEVGKAASIIEESEENNNSINESFNNYPEGKAFRKHYPEVVDVATRLEGQVRGKGTHAAAVVISKDNLRNGDKVYLQYGGKSKKDLTVNWDKNDIEFQGLMKLDILGINALTVLNEAKELIKKNKNIDIYFENINLYDKKVLKEFSKGNTTGVFQFGTYGIKKLCKQMGIDTFMDLSHANALFRPGTLNSGMTEEFVQRKNGDSEIPIQNDLIDKITVDTYGIILYQEQLMRIVNEVAGLDWKIADKVRKVVAKSKGNEEFMKFKKTFADGCINNKTLNKKEAEQLWDLLASFGNYSFNKSHAVAYSVIGYYDMFIKYYYPLEFICASLTYGSDSKKDEIINEALENNLDIRPPKIGKSDSNKWIIKDNILYCPFIEIKGFGEATAKKYSSKKEIKSVGFFDLNEDCPTIKNSNKYEEVLKKIGAYKDEKVSIEQSCRLNKYFDFKFK
jgi:DNA polymerase-3 subunit alpha